VPVNRDRVERMEADCARALRPTGRGAEMSTFGATTWPNRALWSDIPSPLKHRTRQEISEYPRAACPYLNIKSNGISACPKLAVRDVKKATDAMEFVQYTTTGRVQLEGPYQDIANNITNVHNTVTGVLIRVDAEHWRLVANVATKDCFPRPALGVEPWAGKTEREWLTNDEVIGSLRYLRYGEGTAPILQ
jgi:hypothetical protein